MAKLGRESQFRKKQSEYTNVHDIRFVKLTGIRESLLHQDECLRLETTTSVSAWTVS